MIRRDIVRSQLPRHRRNQAFDDPQEDDPHESMDSKQFKRQPLPHPQQFSNAKVGHSNYFYTSNHQRRGSKEERYLIKTNQPLPQEIEFGQKKKKRSREFRDQSQIAFTHCTQQEQRSRAQSNQEQRRAQQYYIREREACVYAKHSQQLFPRKIRCKANDEEEPMLPLRNNTDQGISRKKSDESKLASKRTKQEGKLTEINREVRQNLREKERQIYKRGCINNKQAPHQGKDAHQHQHKKQSREKPVQLFRDFKFYGYKPPKCEPELQHELPQRQFPGSRKQKETSRATELIQRMKEKKRNYEKIIKKLDISRSKYHPRFEFELFLDRVVRRQYNRYQEQVDRLEKQFYGHNIRTISEVLDELREAGVSCTL